MAHLISTNQINKFFELEYLFELADCKRDWYDKNHQAPQSYYPLSGKVIATVFHERSTRTRLSFESAAARLGARVITETELTSSAGKNESLEDTIRTIGCYADLIVLRHPENGAAHRASFHCPVPLINGGDGTNEHPTQAMLDLYTIWRRRKDFNNLRIMFVGDLADSRPIHSLINLIGNQVITPKVYLAPTAGMSLTREWAAKLESPVMVGQGDVPKFLSQIDVLYMTRIQRERKDGSPTTIGDVNKNRQNQFVLRPEHLDVLPGDGMVLHPLPRNNEIHADCDTHGKSLYHTEQTTNGMYLRMALMSNLL